VISILDIKEHIELFGIINIFRTKVQTCVLIKITYSNLTIKHPAKHNKKVKKKRYILYNTVENVKVLPYVVFEI